MLLTLSSRAETSATEGRMLDTAALIEKTRSTLVVLVAEDKQGKQIVGGTGFFISENGIVATAKHVAEAADTVTAFTRDGKAHRVTELLGEDQDYDVAVLKIDGDHYPHLSLGSGLPETNDWVAVLSPTDQWETQLHLTNAPPICSPGQVNSQIRLYGICTLFSAVIPVAPSQSGSPMLTKDGKAIGVTVGSKNEQVVAAAPISVIQGIVAKAGSNAPVAFASRRRLSNPPDHSLHSDPDLKAATDAMRLKDWTEAERRLKLAAAHFPESQIILTALGITHLGLGAIPKALDDSEIALHINPNNAFALYTRGVSLFALSQFADSSRDLRKGIESGSLDAKLCAASWSAIAMAEDQLGHTNQVRDALQRLDILDPKQAATTSKLLQRTNTTGSLK